MPDKNRQSLVSKHPLISYVLHPWDSLKVKTKLMSEKSLLTPFMHNPDFPPGLQKGYLDNWNDGQVTQIFHFCPKAVFPKWEQIREKCNLPYWEYFRYQQVASFIITILQNIQLLYIPRLKTDKKKPPLCNISSYPVTY
ncbi:hypothetical protein XELAEV_18014841mg [Xenopus laevis]|uniref:Uncharacterized protein n=1 Tax=Xenopus laevis TaxID=8355 RepID=A0A974HVN6_XENLA|nr:hypothetical protein XELAEV_18014841mg [Xenopus laevis]